MPRKKKVEAPIITCADCIHEYACCAWTLGGRLATQNAERCPYFDTVRSSAAYLIGKLEANEWISVEDRLPEEGEWVLVYYGNSYGCIMAVLEWTGEFWRDANRQAEMDGFITHWMPLPEPPKED